MSRRILFLLFACSLSTGCVAVTEPLGDADKAEPDKRLVGRWQRDDMANDVYEIDTPAVKGNPKGLMRAAHTGSDAFWFYLTTVGKHTYATIFLHPSDDGKFADFGTEGEFEKWQKGSSRRYFIFRYTLDGDQLTVDGGNEKEFKKLAEGEKFETSGFYTKTPAGWLAKYLNKNGPEAIFDGSNVERRTRVKK